MTKYYLGHKTNLNKLKSIEITQSISYDHKGTKLGIGNRTPPGKFTSTCKLKNRILSNQGIKEEITGEILKFCEMTENKSTTY